MIKFYSVNNKPASKHKSASCHHRRLPILPTPNSITKGQESGHTHENNMNRFERHLVLMMSGRVLSVVSDLELGSNRIETRSRMILLRQCWKEQQQSKENSRQDQKNVNQFLLSIQMHEVGRRERHLENRNREGDANSSHRREIESADSPRNHDEG